MTIVGRPEYDGIEVVGVARFDDGSPDESTDPPAIPALRYRSMCNIEARLSYNYKKKIATINRPLCYMQLL